MKLSPVKPLSLTGLSEQTEFKIRQFEKFYDLLMKNAPEEYEPWFFPCDKNGKNPSPKAILKLDSSSKGSWHHKSARLNKQQCIDHIKRGYNIGLSARKDDPLIIGDIDEIEYLKQLPKETLTATSRKRVGAHFFGWDKDGSAKVNLPTDFGEMRSDNQYVLTSGSYVPFNLESKKDKEAFDKLPEVARNDPAFSFYTVREESSPRPLAFSDLPQFFQDKHLENIEVEAVIKNRDEQKEFKKEGKYTELFELGVSDILGKIPSSKRKGHPLHESDTDANFSLSKDGKLAHCWRHMVSLNAVQYLCVKSNYAKCEDAGSPHGGRGVSKIKGDKEALKSAYGEAVKLGLISENKNGEWERQRNRDIKNYSDQTEQTNDWSDITTKDFLVWSKNYNRYFVNHDKVAEYLIDALNCKTIYGTKSEIVYNYDGRIFQKRGRELIKTMTETKLDSYSKTKDVNEIFEKVKRQTNVAGDFFDNPELNLIPLENGVYNITTKKLEPHSPSNRFTFIIPHEHNPQAKCPNWLRFLAEAMYPEDIPSAKKWFGYCLYRKYAFKKAVIIDGQQNTGKSVFVDTLTKFVGETNKTGIPLQKISRGNDFTKLSLKDKHANIYDDLSSADLLEGGGFKVATGGGYISGEEKFGDYKQFMSFAKLIFTCNKIPPVKDNDDLAYFGRWLVWKFDNVPEKIDPYLREKLWTEEEMSGILNWALEGLNELIHDSGFSYSKTPEEVKRIMEISGCPLVAFSDEVLEKEDNHIITKEDMFQVYSLWIEKTGRPRLGKEKFGRDLGKYCPYILAVKHKDRVWKNAKLTKEWIGRLEALRDVDCRDLRVAPTQTTLSKKLCSTNTNNTTNLSLKNKNKASETSVETSKPTDTNDTISKKGISFDELNIEENNE